MGLWAPSLRRKTAAVELFLFISEPATPSLGSGGGMKLVKCFVVVVFCCFLFVSSSAATLFLSFPFLFQNEQAETGGGGGRKEALQHLQLGSNAARTGAPY